MLNKLNALKQGYVLVLAVGIIFYCYEFFLRISPSVILGDLMSYFQLDAFGVSKLLAIYYVAYTLGQIPAGLIMDRYPVKHVLVIATLCCVAGVGIFVSTPYSDVARIGRFVIGFASSFAFIGVLKIARIYFPPQYFTRLVGITVALGTLCASYAEFFSVHLIMRQGWQTLFYDMMLLGLAITVLLILCFYFVSYESKDECESSWRQTFIDARQLLRCRYIWLNGVIGGLFYLPTSVLAALWGSYFLRTYYGIALDQATIYITTMFFGWMVGSPIMGYLADKLYSLRGLIGGCAIIASAILFFLILHADTAKPYLMLLFFMFGVFSSAQLIVWRIFHRIAPIKMAATGVALTNMMIMLLAAFCQMLFGYLLTFHVHSNDIFQYNSADYHFAFMILPGSLLLAALLSRLLPAIYRPQA